MNQIIEDMNQSDLERVSSQREWVVGHYENPDAYATVEGKIKLIQTILDNSWIESNETVKLQCLGIAFGDALEQDVDELHWVAVEDEFGRDPALRWLETSVLAFPLTSISKRIEDDVEVDVDNLFRGYKKALQHALEKET